VCGRHHEPFAREASPRQLRTQDLPLNGQHVQFVKHACTYIQEMN
jgi:hypothetical protein